MPESGHIPPSSDTYYTECVSVRIAPNSVYSQGTASSIIDMSN